MSGKWRDRKKKKGGKERGIKYDMAHYQPDHAWCWEQLVASSQKASWKWCELLPLVVVCQGEGREGMVYWLLSPRTGQRSPLQCLVSPIILDYSCVGRSFHVSCVSGNKKAQSQEVGGVQHGCKVQPSGLCYHEIGYRLHWGRSKTQSWETGQPRGSDTLTSWLLIFFKVIRSYVSICWWL